jgi:hypothetical protein
MITTLYLGFKITYEITVTNQFFVKGPPHQPSGCYLRIAYTNEKRQRGRYERRGKNQEIKGNRSKRVN